MKINKKVKIKFAFLPTKLDDGSVVFLGRYKEIFLEIEGASWTILARIEDDPTDIKKKNKYYVARGR